MQTDYELVFEINECRACPLGAQRNARALAGQGGCAVPAEVGANYERGGMAFLLEAPGATEDATGRPLVGLAGKLFDQMLGDVGVAREDVLILNKVKCRPPNNNLARVPEAVSNCKQWLDRELATYEPGVIVLMGNTALRDVYGKTVNIGMMRGRPKSRGQVFVPTYHPAFVRRQAQWYRTVLGDLELAIEMVKEVALGKLRGLRKAGGEDEELEVGSGDAGPVPGLLADDAEREGELAAVGGVGA